MIVIGDLNIPFETVEKISSEDDIKKTGANTTVLFHFDLKILNYCFKNSVESAVIIKDILEVIYADNLGARYIIVPKELAKEVQDIADNYMFDSKILAVISSNKEIVQLAKEHIDGVIYQKLLG